MALDLEEQEKLDALKAWWRQYGNLVLLVVAAVALAIAAAQGWRYYQRTQALQASNLYDALTRAVDSGDAKAMRDAGGALIEAYPRTLYASMGALVSARHYFDRGDLKSAKAQLQWVIDRSPSDEFRDLARLRLAAVLLDEKAHDDALKVLEAKFAEAFAAQVAALRGDVLVAKNDTAQARAAYQVALEKADKRNNAFRDSVRMRLEALGG